MPTESIDPALFERADLRAALADHDIGTVYRALNRDHWHRGKW